MYLRKCTMCGLEAKTDDELILFTIGRGSKHGRQNRCKKCESKKHTEKYGGEYARAYDKRKRIDGCPRFNRSTRNTKLKLNYGITLDIFEQMVMEQGNKCKICGSDNNDRTLHVDHCHTTLKIRGLLCSKCNSGLGMFNDNTEMLQLAINYLTLEGY